MRRMVAFFAAIGLVVSLAGTSVAAPPKPLFVGDFAVLRETTVIGHVSAQLFLPTQTRLVPGTVDFVGAPDYLLREAHATIAYVEYWHDDFNRPPGGSDVVLAGGVQCYYFAEPGDTSCHQYKVAFVNNIDPSVPDEVHVHVTDPSGAWVDPLYLGVGPGAFVLTLPTS